MSKLYNKYKKLKAEVPQTFYIFKSGIFYVFLDEDAKNISELLHLKLVNLNETVMKCAFPISRFTHYIQLLEELKIPYRVIDEDLNPIQSITDYSDHIEISNILSSIRKVDLNKLSPIQALNMLSDFQTTLNHIKEQSNE